MKRMGWKRLQIPYEFLMAVLAFVNVYFYYFEITGVLETSEIAMAVTIDRVSLGIFAADYLVRLYLSKNKRAFLSHNVLELIALIPLSPIFRVARLFRCIVLFIRFFKRLRTFSSVNMFLYVAFGAIVVLMTSALLIAPLENMTFLEGLWWGVVTIATVGYGDFVPVTAAGRLIAIVLMFSGIGFLSFLTGTITTHYVNAHMEKAGIDSHRGILRHYQEQLFRFESMSEGDIDDMHKVLKSLKQEEMKLKQEKRMNSDLKDDME